MKDHAPNHTHCGSPRVESWPLVGGVELQVRREPNGRRYALVDGPARRVFSHDELIADRVRVAHQLRRDVMQSSFAALPAQIVALARRAGAAAVRLAVAIKGRPLRSA